MFKVSKTFKFEAAHYLPNHDGKCKKMHGHSYRVQVVVGGDMVTTIGPKDGMLLDFGDLNALVAPIVDGMDHTVLNELPIGVASNPTAERLAQWLFVEISEGLGEINPHRAGLRAGVNPVWLERVRVYETDTCYAEWCR